MIEVYDAIADGLAENSYAVADQFLSQTEVRAILGADEFRYGVGQFQRAGIGKQQQHHVNEGIRGDYINWLDKNTASAEIALYLNRVRDLMQRLNETLFLSLKDFEMHVTVYPVGSFYKRHLDQFKKDDHRKLTIICYLNEDWEEQHGGQLRVYLRGRSVDILPTAGRMVCFRSDKLEHEVLPAIRERLSLTGWILDQYADLKHLS
jgi:SM-20-related protein